MVVTRNAKGVEGDLIDGFNKEKTVPLKEGKKGKTPAPQGVSSVSAPEGGGFFKRGKETTVGGRRLVIWR